MPAALLALLRSWRIAGLCLLLAMTVAQHFRIVAMKHRVEAALAANDAQVAEYRVKASEAIAAATTAKAATEAAQAKITQEVSDDYQKRLDAFRAAYARRLQAGTDTSGTGKADLPSLSIDPAIFVGPGGSAVLPAADVETCGVNTLRLIAARDWALKIGGN